MLCVASQVHAAPHSPSVPTSSNLTGCPQHQLKPRPRQNQTRRKTGRESEHSIPFVPTDVFLISVGPGPQPDFGGRQKELARACCEQPVAQCLPRIPGRGSNYAMFGIGVLTAPSTAWHVHLIY